MSTETMVIEISRSDKTGDNHDVERTTTRFLTRATRQTRSLSALPPARLTNFAPPLNFGAVEEGKIYRSAFPKDENFDFLREIGIKSVIILTGEVLSPSYLEFLSNNQISWIQYDVPQNKNGEVKIEQALVREVLNVVLQNIHQPMLIHCNGGKHRTGCVTACFRKIQKNGETEAALAEYEVFARGKSRDGDRSFIGSFDIAANAQKATETGWISA
ncbi:hypothetical protein B9Z65_8895 [Elsinoe australis]|uniref:Uncharacterized protein n=1 Tax=Elsinoe australis TaxID=40998 RepID=A0A2P7YF19_9PEZI|nr:hypothetical protein B9Z65_8895 [Elsinoe australis]